MTILHVIILAIVQGLAELLPVSSSAHVVVAEKLMGLDPSSPAMTLLLVMLHTGTMFAVIVYFWRQWRNTYFRSMPAFKHFAWLIILATALTGIIGEVIQKIIEKTAFKDAPHAEIESLFSHLELIAPALAAAGILIFLAGIFERRKAISSLADAPEMTNKQAGIIGIVQGLCLPFRGFSRSGATISAGMLSGVTKVRAETFSFASCCGARGVALDESRESRRSNRLAIVRSDERAWRRFRLPGWSGGVEMAQPVVGRRPLVPVRHLLPGGGLRGFLAASPGLLRVITYLITCCGRTDGNGR
jgi:undecaprenyl-diphosphatase